MLRHALVALLIISSFASAYCPTTSREVNMAAVVSENSGGIFVLHVKVQPGNGSVYTSINPRIGFSTQESEQEAVDYAFSQSDVDQSGCDVLFSMSGNFGSNKIDGPSAGGAMSVAVKAALTNRSIRRDVVMTGTISQDGDVGEVGGIIEKALAAKEAGAKYILVPKMMMHEALLLSAVSQDGGFSAIEVTNFSEAERILYSGYSETFKSDYIPKSDSMPKGLPSRQYDADTARFSMVARKLVGQLDSQVSGALYAARVAGSGSAASEEYFSGEISKYKKQIEMGYPFTAANAAFLLSVDAEYLKIGGTEVDINGSIDEVSACLSTLTIPQKTRENFHWATGADLRRIWAQNKLNETIASRSDREAYSTLRDLLLSYGWCGISRELAAQADDIGGTPINESALETLADKRLSEADNALTSSSFLNGDAFDHLQNGVDAYDQGAYGAAIYEATYAEAMQGAADLAGSINFSEEADFLSNSTRDSLWGKVYFGQGIYLNYASKEKLASPSDAYRILYYSEALDDASAAIDDAFLRAPDMSKKEQPLPGGSQALVQCSSPAKPLSFAQKATESLALLSCVAALAFIIFMRMSKGRIGNQG